MKNLTSLCITFMRLHLERIPQVSVITGPNQWTSMNCLPFCSLLLTLEVLACISLSISNYRCLPIDKLWFIFLSLVNILKEDCLHVKLPWSCPTLCDPMDCSPPGSSIHEILQARTLEWVAVPPLGNLPAPGSNPPILCPLHWQVGSLPLVPPQFSSVHSLSCVQLFASPWSAACQASLSITNSRSLLKLMSIRLVMPSFHLILCHTLLYLPSIFPNSRVFSNELVLCIGRPE